MNTLPNVSAPHSRRLARAAGQAGHDRYRGVFDAYYPGAYAFVSACLGKEQDVAGAVAAAFSQALPSIDDGRDDAFPSCLYRAACQEVSRRARLAPSSLLMALVFDASLSLQESARVLGLAEARARRLLHQRLRRLARAAL